MNKYIKSFLTHCTTSKSSIAKLFTLSALTFGLIVSAQSAKAAVLTHGVLGQDELGRPQVTFQTNSWRDMMDTYLASTLLMAPDETHQFPWAMPNFASGSNAGTIRFEVTDTIMGDAVWANIIGNGTASPSQHQDTIREGRSLYINGNGHTLYFDNDTTPTSGIGGRGDATGNTRRRGWFAGVQGVTGAAGNSSTVITESTRMTLANAIVQNSITGGIFQARGANVRPTFVYKDVNYSNAVANNNATPIYSQRAQVQFSGNNIFTIREATSTASSNSGTDNHGEFIEGSGHVEVLDGHTTLNYSWGRDQPFFLEHVSGTTHNLILRENAKLIFNMNASYAMYWSRASGNQIGMNWQFEDGAEFIIHGTNNTGRGVPGMRGGNTWFQSAAYQQWDWTMERGAKFVSHAIPLPINLARSGGGLGTAATSGMGGFHAPVRWNFGPDSEFIINSPSDTQIATNAIIAGSPPAGSDIVLNDVRSFTLNSRNSNVNQSVIARDVRNFPIHILREGVNFDPDGVGPRPEIIGVGDGLRTHISRQGAPFDDIWDGTFDTVIFNRRTLHPTVEDLWLRANSGVLTNLTSTPPNQVSTLFPNALTELHFTALRESAFISFFKPTGFFMQPDLSNMDSTYSIDLASLPFDGSFSDWLEKDESSQLVVGDDRGQNPNFHITVALIENLFPQSLNFSWVDFEGNRDDKLELNVARPVISITDDANLPNFVDMTGAGAFYEINFAENRGAQLQARNNLQLGQAHAGTFRYSINDGPGIQ